MGRKRIMNTSELTLKVAICGMNQNKIVQLGTRWHRRKKKYLERTGKAMTMEETYNI
jgi:hypothetical protein